MENPSRNFLVTIITSFTNVHSMDEGFIIKWKKLLKNKDLNFIIYKIYVNVNQGTVIESYVELSRYYRKIKVKNDFCIISNAAVHVETLRVTKDKDKLYLKKILNDTNPDNIYWFGKPRFEGKVLNPINYEFVLRYNLFDKAKSNHEIPATWININEEKNVQIKEVSLGKKDVLFLDFVIDLFIPNPTSDKLFNASNRLFSELIGKNKGDIKTLYKFFHRKKRAEINWTYFLKFFKLNDPEILKKMGYPNLKTLKKQILVKTKESRNLISEIINIDIKEKF
jgi:hypothetical protein